MFADTPQRVDRYRSVPGAIVENESCTAGFRFRVLERTADAGGEVRCVKSRVGADLDEGAGDGFESAISRRGLGQILRVPS